MTRQEEFIADVRQAIAMLGTPDVEADSSHIDAVGLQAAMAGGDHWLTIKVVENFDASDWTQLPPHSAAALANSVFVFRAVAQAIPSNAPATSHQMTQARAALLQIARAIGVA